MNGKHDESLEMLNKAFEIEKKIYNENKDSDEWILRNPEVIMTMSEIAFEKSQLGFYNQAIEEYKIILGNILNFEKKDWQIKLDKN